MAVAASAASALAACTSSADQSGTGVVTGVAPLCYGPGRNTNLKPITTILAVRTDGLMRALRVHTSNDHSTYRMTLPAGTYEIRAYSGHIRVVVRGNKTTRHADLPGPGCR